MNSSFSVLTVVVQGLGKTIQCLGLIAHLIETKREMGPYLIIAPLSTLNNWKAEFQKWAPRIVVVAYQGTRDARSDLWRGALRPGAFQVVLTTFEFIMNKHDMGNLSRVQWKYIVRTMRRGRTRFFPCALCLRCARIAFLTIRRFCPFPSLFSVQIIDEGHRVKNHQSKLALTLAAKYRHVPHRVILSGTPLQNSLRELWALLNFLLPTIFDSAESFDEWFSKPFESQGIISTRGADADAEAAAALLDEEEKLIIIHRLHQILRPFLLRRMKRDVASQLPPKREAVIKCSLTPWQTLMYGKIRSQAALASVGASGQLVVKRVHNTIMQLRKIVNHPFLFEDHNPAFQQNYVASPDIVRCSGKFDLLHRMLAKLLRTGHRVLLFSQMTRVLDIIADYLEWKAITFVRLDGESSSEQRSEAQERFNRPDTDVHLFILSTKAGGLGLNLQSADTVILFGQYNQ